MVIKLNQVRKSLFFTVVILRQLSTEMWVLETEKYKLLCRAFFFFHLKKTVLINLIESRPWKKLKNMYRSQMYPRKVLYITLLLLLHNVISSTRIYFREIATLKVETIFVIQKKWKINTEALLLVGTVYFSVKRFMIRTHF